METKLQVRNLRISFRTTNGKVQAVRDISFDLGKGETLAIVGESGSGKSVTSKAILGILAGNSIVEGGEILYDGKDLLKIPEEDFHKIRGDKIAMIFQDPMTSLNPVFTVGHQIENVLIRNQGLKKKEASEKAIEMISTVKLPDPAEIMKKYPHELSGGQRQRIIIAMALCCGAEFMIADEPTRNLDVTIQAGILKLISELQREFGITDL